MMSSKSDRKIPEKHFIYNIFMKTIFYAFAPAVKSHKKIERREQTLRARRAYHSAKRNIARIGTYPTA